MERLDIGVCILGAGPGGCGAALKLAYSGIPCVLADKAVFPRDKVCGDALSGKVLTTLGRIDEGLLQRLQTSDFVIDCWGIKFVAPNGKDIPIAFRDYVGRQKERAPGFVATRFHFDNWLVQEARSHSNIRFLEGCELVSFERTAKGYLLRDKSGEFEISCRLLIVADGAHSTFSRKIAGLKMDPRYHAAAVRAYVENVDGFHEGNFIELHFLKKYLPGYFWVFPLPGGKANVGLGILSSVVSRKKFNLKAELKYILEEDATFRERFRNSRVMGEIQGYGLPLGSRWQDISGDHYMLVGDAAHLIDPLTGEGIGNAIYSGWIAAQQAMVCLQTNSFDANTLKAYDARVKRTLYSEMRLSYRLQRLVQYPFFFNAIANKVTRNQNARELITFMFHDALLQEKLLSPMFWLKLIWDPNPGIKRGVS